MVELLLDEGANISFIHSYYGTALQQAARMKHKDIARLLLARGTLADLQGQNGRRYGSPLQIALD